MAIRRFETDIAGKKLIIETGKLGAQAGASVTAQMGDTVIMATATMAKDARPGLDFFPLMVDYEERYFAAGSIKGPRFSKREGRPSSEAILIGRMIDRGLRPLFRQDMRNDVQVICLPLSLDHENKPDIVAMLAACTALHISNIPFDGPVAGVRIGRINGHFVVNPTVEELEYTDLRMAVMGNGERITMVECDAMELSDGEIKDAFMYAMEVLGPIASFMNDVRKEIGKEKAGDDELILQTGLAEEDKAVIEQLKAAAIPKLDKYLFNTPKGSKRDRKDIMDRLKEELIEEFKGKLATPERDEEATVEYLKGLFKAFYYGFMEEQVTTAILDRDQRVDGRKLDQIRPLEAEVGVLPRTHGSGLFSRGETQILSVVTLGAPRDDLSIETMERDAQSKYFHHYNFLPFSVGEVKPLRGAGRREIGHGALAEKAMRPVLPSEDDFPYTVRVVSEVMSSNGSSSMASTCGSTLALMDAGVPIKKPVAGIAMGLASNGDRWKVLTDLQDLEDGEGGMDFKFTSTRDGITAIQMDTKTRGLTREMIEATMPQMRQAVNEVLDLIERTIPSPRPELSPYAPRITKFFIDPEKIKDVIGPGGKMIKSITEEFEVTIDVEDDGSVVITSLDPEKASGAEQRIKSIVKEVEVGEIYEEAEVVNIMSFGAFVKLTPSQDGLCHVSEIAWEHVEKVEDVLKLGDKVRVKVIGIERGKVDVSMRALLPKPEGYVERPRKPRRSGDRRGGPRGRSGDRRGGDRRGGDRRGGDRRGGDRRGGDRRDGHKRDRPRRPRDSDSE